METILDKLRSRGFSLTANDGKLFVEPASGLTEEDRAAIRANKAALLQSLADPSIELEAILTATWQQITSMTTEPNLLDAARNLLNDCREIWREGKAEQAKRLSQHLAMSIPEYIMKTAQRTS